ncbi:oxidoreductase [Thalassoroseus pseudoceratinae]|uniref:oxidoreductase n=1 Tax=Thalassoroseus pseudoceratinae TaxID=2713176 RepID=UPI0014225918|nr:NADH:flavin oxidoreductase [Thalassoroseus pseudoceratinae]
MARYFKYKSLDDLAQDATRLGEPLALSEDFSVLFQPLEIGHRTVGNRLAIQPMEGCDGTPDGFPDELTFRRYQRFGAGGAKLIWGEATAISDEGRMNPRQLWIHDGSVSDISRMLAECRNAHQQVNDSADDFLIGLQLTHSGRFSCRYPQIVVRDPLLDPLTIDKKTGQPISADYPVLSDDDLKRIEDQYLAAAKLANQAGVDFIDLKQCHRYLLSELLGAKHRPGDYGGSLENRTRLIRNIIGRIRSEFPQMLIATRMNVYDGIPFRGQGEDFIGQPVPHSYPLQTAFGTDPEDYRQEDLTEPLQVAKWLREWGVHLINVSMGNPYANPHLVRPAEFPPVDGYHAPEHPLIGVQRHFRLAAEIQKAVPDIPVMGSGYSWLQDYAMHAAAGNIETGRIQLIGMGRATLSHPDFVNTLRETGEMNRKKICRTFSYCTNLMRTKDHPLGQYATGCPPFDKDVYGPLWKDAQAVRAKSE